MVTTARWFVLAGVAAIVAYISPLFLGIRYSCEVDAQIAQALWIAGSLALLTTDAPTLA